ncbi:MAG: hypothetical protein KA248_09555 [Kiritimatiellae bacterium]|nr:hypothetical protein [Kiritimatiellia bacterium]
MDVFSEYRPSSDTCPQHIARAHWLGLIPVGLALAMMFAARSAPGPGLWSALGTALGLHLVLGGAARLPSVAHPGPDAAADAWFPLLLFVLQTGFVIVTAVMMWVTLGDLGHAPSAAEEAVFYALLAGIPLHRLVRSQNPQAIMSPRRQRWELFLRYLKRSLAAILAGLLLTNLLRDADGRIGPGGIILAISLWVATVLFVLGCLTFFVERAIEAGRESQSSRSPTAPPG